MAGGPGANQNSYQRNNCPDCKGQRAGPRKQNEECGAQETKEEPHHAIDRSGHGKDESGSALRLATSAPKAGISIVQIVSGGIWTYGIM